MGKPCPGSITALVCAAYCSTTVSPKSIKNSCVLSVGKLGTPGTTATMKKWKWRSQTWGHKIFGISSSRNVLACNGKNNVLSKFFLCDLRIFRPQHKSAEHDFQYRRALRCGDHEAVMQIQQSETALLSVLATKVKQMINGSNPVNLSWPKL